MSTTLEEFHVHHVYSKISSHFHSTRFHHWNMVKQFLDSFSSKDYLFDNGCGNGKYLSYRKDITIIGNDICENLLRHAKVSHSSLLVQANCLQLPYRSNIFDGGISIAVLHHLSTEEGRKNAIEEMIRILQPGGRCLVSVWAFEQEDMGLLKKWKLISGTDYFVPWHSREGIIYDRYYHLFPKQEISDLFQSFPSIEVLSIRYEKSNWFVEFQKIKP